MADSKSPWYKRLSRWLGSEWDLVLLLVAALVSLVLDLLGTTSQGTTISALLGLLGLLAVSMIRSRSQTARLAASFAADPLGRLLWEYPSDLETWRNTGMDLLLVGTRLERTSASYSRAIAAALDGGARVRVLVTDPEYFKGRSRNDLAKVVKQGIGKLQLAARSSTGPGTLSIRVLPYVPVANYNIIDPDERHGVVVWQYHEFLTHPRSEAAPILVLRSSDGEWYAHLRRDAENMWEAGDPWPKT